MKIIHIAPQNFVGIPMRLVKEERRLGHTSNLIVLQKHPHGLEEDIVLKLPFNSLSSRTSVINRLRRIGTKAIDNRRADELQHWQPSSKFEELFFKTRDRLSQSKLLEVWDSVEGDKADLIILDGGHGLQRYDNILTTINTTKFAIYYGSDLRTRGIILEIDAMVAKNYTFEFDHTFLMKDLEFLFYPFDFEEIVPFANLSPSGGTTLKVGHAPTNRAAKGTDQILAALEKINKEIPLEIILIENVSYHDALALKSNCDFFIDQVGELGYGLNSVESLGLGIPTAVELMPDFESFLGEHPFYNIKRESLYKDLKIALNDIHNWANKSESGFKWVQEKHSVPRVVEKYLSDYINLL